MALRSANAGVDFDFMVGSSVTWYPPADKPLSVEYDQRWEPFGERLRIGGTEYPLGSGRVSLVDRAAHPQTGAQVGASGRRPGGRRVPEPAGRPVRRTAGGRRAHSFDPV